MSHPFRIMTVCIGNICRSPLAERLLRLHLAAAVEAGRVEITSAGVRAVVDHPIDAPAVPELVRLGGDPEGFAARRLTAELMEPTDLVLTATVDVRTDALRHAPRAMRRTFTFTEFAALCRELPEVEGESVTDFVARAAANRGVVQGVDLDVVDPIGRSAAFHRDIADQIDGAVRAIAARLGPMLAAGLAS
ncbi:hypothetical protein [Nocardioides sp.]|uniref:arsenate reductase/protein-tyrosine-phosphatase family protein n=1 Tax=Nocardioides sp. TaxID=35761 RepID=UPI003569E66F